MNTQSLLHATQLKDMIELPGNRGYIKEIHRSVEKITIFDSTLKMNKERDASSTIELWMDVTQRIPYHLSASTETFKYIDGRDMIIHLISSAGAYQKIFLGKENDGAVLEFVVPANTWFAEEVTGEQGYSHVSVITEPGYHPDDIQEASRDDLLQLVANHPGAVESIYRFTETCEA